MRLVIVTTIAFLQIEHICTSDGVGPFFRAKTSLVLILMPRWSAFSDNLIKRLIYFLSVAVGTGTGAHKCKS